MSADDTRSGESSRPQPTTLQERAEEAFHAWLELCREGKRPDEQSFVAGQPAELRGELRRMLADYRVLLGTIGEGTTGFVPGREFGDFRLVRELGRGGMGIVWEAEQLSLGRRVALKLLYPHWSLSPHLLERFQREAEAGGRLAHEGIVRVLAVGEQESTHYIAQELVPGGLTLADSLDDLRAQGELPKGYHRSVAELFVKIADALEAAHAAGVVHRDVKPGNILIAEGDVPKVADFGLAKVADALTLSRTGELTGTPFYMSPEQAASKRIGIDHRTDVFSLGATLYEALTLERPFAGETTQEVMERILLEDPVDPRRVRSDGRPDVPRDLAVICTKALEKRRERRYASMAELRDDLRAFLAGHPIAARPPGALDRATKLVRRHPNAATAAAAILLGLGLGVLLTRGDAGAGAPSEADAADRASASGAARGTVVRQVWPDAEDVLGGPTPDGRALTFTDWNAYANLAVRDLATGASRRLTDWGMDGGFAEFSAVSPDGALVAWSKCTEYHYDLRVVGLDGSNPRQVFDDADAIWIRPTVWAPDSSAFLAYAVYADHGEGLVLVPVDGGAAREIVRLEASGDERAHLSDAGMGFSPDGGSIVYSRPARSSDARCDVFVRDLATGAEHPLVAHPADDRVLGWSPDGGQVLFASDRRGSWGAWTVAVANGRAAGEPVLVESLPADLSSEGGFHVMGFAADGSLYYCQRRNLSDVMVVPFDARAGRVTGSAALVAPDLPGTHAGLAWSPDGERLAFAVQEEGANRIVVAQPGAPAGAPAGAPGGAFGGALRELELPADVRRLGSRSLRWSPDGERFAVSVRGDALTGDVWRLAVVDARTGALTLVGEALPGLEQYLPEWTPDGRKLLYLRQPVEKGPAGGLYALDVESGRSELLYRSQMLISSVALSPDGRWLAFSENLPTDFDDRAILVIPAAGGEPRRVAVSGEHGTFPLWTPIAWAPDGRSLYYGRDDARQDEGHDKNPIELVRVPFEPDEPGQPGERAAPETTGLVLPWLRLVRIHPDGDRIAVEAGERRRGVWVIEDFLPDAGGAAPLAAATPEGSFNQRLLSPYDIDLNSLYDIRPSPDGKRVAYGRMGSDGRIVVRDLATGAETQVTEGEFTYSDGPLWSPDQTRLAYRVHPEGVLKIVEIASATSRVPAGAEGADLWPQDWSPDGARILCKRQVDASTISLVELSLATGELATLVPEGLNGGSAVYAPDGRCIVYSALVDGDRELFQLARDGTGYGETLRLTEAPGEDERPLWSPAGDLLVYAHRGDVWGIPFDPSDSAAGPTGVPRFLRGGSLEEPLEWIAGRGIYTRRHDQSSTFYTVDLGPDGAPAGPPREALDFPVEHALRHLWSPDGAWVLYNAYLDDRIFLLSTRDGSLRTFETGADGRPKNIWWSASGDRAYLNVSPGQAQTILALDPVAGTLEPLFPPIEKAERLHLHPNGQRMLLFRYHEHRADGERELVVTLLPTVGGQRDGGVVVARETDPELGTFSNWVRPVFSPDGERILFGTLAGDLWIAATDGSERHLLAGTPERTWGNTTQRFLHSAVWHPSGETVYFDDWKNLFAVDVATGAMRELPLDLTGFDRIDGLWQVSADGARLAITGASGVGPELWLVRELSWAE